LPETGLDRNLGFFSSFRLMGRLQAHRHKVGSLSQCRRPGTGFPQRLKAY
jgi:hypothetical protein